MKNITLSIVVFMSFFLFSGCQHLFKSRPQKINLKIITTTDVHGSIFPYDLIYDKETQNSLAQAYNYIKNEREKPNQEVLLLDNGDILQGQPTVYYSNFVDLENKHICSRVMNFMKYDAATVGNHDIEPGHSVYDKLVKEFAFPWLAANAVELSTKEPYFQPYTIIEKAGIRIAVLGLITPAIPNWLPENIWAGIEFHDMIQTAKKWVKIINEKEKPDLLIGLFHSGTDATYNRQDKNTPKNENASLLVAEQVPGFDVIFAGHDHRIFKSFVRNPNGKDVLLIDGKAHAEYVSDVTVEFTWNKETEKYDKKIDGKVLALENQEQNTKFMEEFSAFFNEVKDYVSKKIGFFATSISTRDAMFGNSEFIDLIHTIQLQLTEAEISFTSPLSYNASIEAGNVYVKDMFKLYKFENLLYKMELSGQEIKDYLEYSYGDWFNTMKNENDHLIRFKYDDAGNMLRSQYNDAPELHSVFFNFSSAAGINYTVDVSKPQGERINIISLSDNTSFDLQKKYTVAINSYRGNGGGGHLTLGAKIAKDDLPERVLFSTEKDLRFYMIQWLEEHDTISPKKYNNWKVVPEKWWKKAKDKDIKLMYPQAEE